jgi:peptide/nickel transport system ATP-binding protein
MADLLPGQLSGGQRQRVAVARALALEPGLLIADEPTSALDVSVRAQILNLLLDLKERLGLALVFVSHDIQTVRRMSDRVVTMYLGRIVEQTPARAVPLAARHPYTRALFSATPGLISPINPIPLVGSVPSATRPPSGCPFRTRCWRADEACAAAWPEARADGDHLFHCHHPVAAGATDLELIQERA